MTSKLKLLATLVLGVGTLAAPSLSYAADNSCDSSKTTTVRFKKDAFSEVYRGKVTGYQCVNYKFYANQGQFLRVKLISKGQVDVIMWQPEDMSFTESEPYILPKRGFYELRVLQNRNSARKNTSSTYTLEIKIVDNEEDLDK